MYEKLGSLFYAVANADAQVRRSEEKMLVEKINAIWLPHEDSTDEFGTDAAHYIFIVFDQLHADGAEAEGAFNDFSRYYAEQSTGFDESVKSKIMQTAEALADAFSGKNQAEKDYLKRLKKMMK